MPVEAEIQEQFFAKLSGKRGEHLLVFSGNENMSKDAIRNYTVPNVSHAVDFAPGRSLHDDEWFKIHLESEHIATMVEPYLNNASSNADNVAIRAEDYQKVVALYKTDGTILLVTRVVPGMRVESKTLIGLNDHPELKSYTKAIEFTGQVDAYYDGNSGFYFKKYSKVSSLFDGIEVFYREATEPEKSQFLAKGFFAVAGIDTSNIGMRDASKIAIILDDERIALEDEAFQQRVVDYTKRYQPELVSDDNKLKITDKQSLHEVLDVLTERYYESGLFGDKCVALDSAKLEA